MIEWVGSPNYSEERNPIKKIIVHWIVGHIEAADAVFSNHNSQVSAHYAVEGSQIHQYVDEDNTAWHAGEWGVNLESIGIEHAGGPDLPISDDTYKTSAKLIQEICKRYDIPIDSNHIIPHRDIVATQCPGTLDLERLIKMATQDLVDWEALAIRYKAERDHKDVKLEAARDKLAEAERRDKAHIEELQKTVAELNQINSSLMADKKISQDALNAAQLKFEALEVTVQEISNDFNKLSEDCLDIETKLIECRKKKKISDHSFLDWLKAKWGGY